MALETKLKRITESHGRDAGLACLQEAFTEGKVKRKDISIRRLAEAYMGENWSEHLTRANKTGRVTESVEAVDTSGFQAITGQLMVDVIKERYQLAARIGDRLTKTVPITNGNLGTQVVPYLSSHEDMPDTVNQGMPYKHTKFRGQYYTLPAPVKKGRICCVTMEMIYSDLTGQAYEAANSGADLAALEREERILKVVAGVVNNYSWNGTTYNTYGTSGNWINKVLSFDLLDWNNLNTLEQLFAEMKDPVTGKPIDVNPTQLLVSPARKYTTKNLLNATEVRNTVPGYAVSANPSQTVSESPIETDYEVLTSKNLKPLLVAAGKTSDQANRIGLIGDFQKAFVWREAEPMKVEEAPPVNPMNFQQDIALAVKVRTWGEAGVADPRYAALFTSEAS